MRQFPFLFAMVVLLAGCTGTGPYRGKIGDTCGRVQVSLGEKNDELTTNRDSADCAMREYTLDRRPDLKFRLAFVELGAGEGGPLVPEQLNLIGRSLDEEKMADKKRQQYVIAFVHGWRHDAKVGDNDVRRFRILLAYARSYLDQRCHSEAKRYCDASLTGVFIGWRGRSFDEPVDNSGLLWEMGTLPTFWARKAESERKASLALSVLRKIAAKLNLRAGDVTADKMLIVGHSMGGNVLATALRDPVLQAIDERDAQIWAKGRAASSVAMPPVLGDLTVLINPAAEAEKWVAIQKHLRDIAGLSSSKDNVITEKWRNFFPIYQRPTYISVTSTDDWSIREAKEIVPSTPDTSANTDRLPVYRERHVKSDQATDFVFTTAQIASLKWGREERQAIGHMMPDLTEVGKENIYEWPYGLTHELITNASQKKETRFSSAFDRQLSQCNIVDGWLTLARDRYDRKHVGYGARWDSSSYPTGEEKLPRDLDPVLIRISSKPHYQDVSVQFRQVINRRGEDGKNKVDPSVISANAPFWNIRAFDTVVSEHSGYVNHATWCAINQLVLDDVVSKNFKRYE